MSTLLLGWPEKKAPDVIHIPARLAIDAGQGWYVDNFREVMGVAIKELGV